jgi:hypothetical protein
MQEVRRTQMTSPSCGSLKQHYHGCTYTLTHKHALSTARALSTLPRRVDHTQKLPSGSTAHPRAAYQLETRHLCNTIYSSTKHIKNTVGRPAGPAPSVRYPLRAWAMQFVFCSNPAWPRLGLGARQFALTDS